MSLTTREPGKQHYTLLVSHNNERDSDAHICSYGMSGAILTTDHDALMEYAQLLVHHFGRYRTYTIATVIPTTELNAINKFYFSE